MLHKLNRLIVAVIFLFVAVNLSGAKLEIDPKHSEVGFSVKHLMISNVKGKFKKYSGEIEFDPKTKTFQKFNATVDASSIDTGIEKRDAHLRNEDFFHVTKFPSIIFEMNSYEADGDEGILKGDLTMHGVTKAVKLNVEYNGMVKDPWGNIKAGFSITGKLNRKDFGLTYNKILEAGGVTIGDKVKLQIELQTLVK